MSTVTITTEKRLAHPTAGTWASANRTAITMAEIYFLPNKEFKRSMSYPRYTVS